MRRRVAQLVIAAFGLLTFSSTPAFGQLHADPVANGLLSPVGFVQNPADPTVQVILEQAGRIRVLKGGVLQAAPFLDLTSQIASGGEQGLLGLAFSPDYALTGRVFVSFTNRQGNSVIARFLRSAADPLRADPGSQFDLVWPDGQRVIAQPFSNHNGGHIVFGPDGYLYFGLGDGGSANDPSHFAQNPLALLGKMLRIDVSVPTTDPQGYDVPPSNPFVGRGDVLPEIWAFGLRNPWRWSFDKSTGALIIGDVGQNAWEEVDYEPAGAGGRNYGWRNREGAHNNVTTLQPFSQPVRDPIWEYPPSVGRSIIGGFVYRGSALGAAYAGRYFFADFVTSRVWSFALTVNTSTREATAGTLVEHTAELGAASASPTSFGVDMAGELYIVSYTGAIYRIGGPPLASGARRAPAGAAVGTARPRVR